MNRTEMLARLEPILTSVVYSVDELGTLMHAPQFDEDYKVSRATHLSQEAFDRVESAAKQLEKAVQALVDGSLPCGKCHHELRLHEGQVCESAGCNCRGFVL